MSEVGGDFNWTSVHSKSISISFITRRVQYLMFHVNNDFHSRNVEVKPTIHTVPNDIDGDDSSYGSRYGKQLYQPFRFYHSISQQVTLLLVHFQATFHMILSFHKNQKAWKSLERFETRQ